jgi:S1-C subfamily serine protease
MRAPILVMFMGLALGPVSASAQEVPPDPTEDPAAAPGDAPPAPRPAEPVVATAPDAPGGAASGPPAVPPPPVADVSATCVADARDAGRDAVVRVRSGGEWGAGFLYRTPRHVVSSFSLVEQGRGITVVDRRGRSASARVVARDEAFDLVVLELAEAIEDLVPLEPAPETAVLPGAPVVVMGHPFGQAALFLGARAEGLLRWSVTPGTVAAANPDVAQLQVGLEDGHRGGAVLDCRGRVIGAVADDGILSPTLALVGRVSRIDAALERGEREPSGYDGDVRLSGGISGLVSVDQDGRVASGASLTLGGILFDQVSWLSRAGLLQGGADEPVGGELDTRRRLLRFESLLGYRFFIDVGRAFTVHLVPSLGLTVTQEDDDTDRARVVPVPPTDGVPCTPSETETCTEVVVERLSDERWIARPAAGLAAVVGNAFELGYTFELDLEGDDVRTVHTFRIGLLF